MVSCAPPTPAACCSSSTARALAAALLVNLPLLPCHRFLLDVLHPSKSFSCKGHGAYVSDTDVWDTHRCLGRAQAPLMAPMLSGGSSPTWRAPWSRLRGWEGSQGSPQPWNAGRCSGGGWGSGSCRCSWPGWRRWGTTHQALHKENLNSRYDATVRPYYQANLPQPAISSTYLVA